MKPVVLSSRPVSGISKKSGREFSCICYDVLYRNQRGGFSVESVFIDSSIEPRLFPGDLVQRNGFTSELEKIGHSDVFLEVLDTLN